MERPILFSTPMVQAILDGRKTQTRRIIKKQPVYDTDSGYKYWDNLMFDLHDDVLETMYMPDHCFYGEIGGILWVRETWIELVDHSVGFSEYLYKADCQPEYAKQIKWKSSIFMTKEACRIKLEIVNIRVERLQDISETDSMAEGVSNAETFKGIGVDETKANRYAYRQLWESINGKDSWSINPWVWVIEFKKL